MGAMTALGDIGSDPRILQLATSITSCSKVLHQLGSSLVALFPQDLELRFCRKHMQLASRATIAEPLQHNVPNQRRWERQNVVFSCLRHPQQIKVQQRVDVLIDIL